MRATTEESVEILTIIGTSVAVADQDIMVADANIVRRDVLDCHLVMHLYAVVQYLYLIYSRY